MASLFLRLLLILVIALSAYCFWPHRSSLDAFEPARIGELEVEVWRLAQKKDRSELFLVLYRIAEGEFRLPPISAISFAWHTSEAILIFERGADRADEEQALDPLQQALRILNEKTDAGYDVEVVTRLELFEWMLAKDKNKQDQLASAIAEKNALKYRLSASACGPAAGDFAKSRRFAREGRWSEAVKSNTAGWKRLKETLTARTQEKQPEKRE